MIERMPLAGARSGMKLAIIRRDAPPRPAGEYAMDTKQSDVTAGCRGIWGRVSVRARFVGKPYGPGADRSSDRAGCARWAYCAEGKNGHAHGGATGYPRRPHD